jgi:hypothetical protein
MTDETAAGSARAPDGRGHPRVSPGEQSPLQARAQFLKNRSWELVAGLNRGACARGGAQHGFNRETQAACASEWAEKQSQTLSLEEIIEFLRGTTHGTVIRKLEDGRLVWKVDGSGAEFSSLPEGLARD